MDEQMSDHDVLIKLDAKLDDVLRRLATVEELQYKVARLEQEAVRDSEKIKALSEVVSGIKLQTVNAGDIAVIKVDVAELKRKSDRWDIMNSLGVAIATILGILYGGGK